MGTYVIENVWIKTTVVLCILYHLEWGRLVAECETVQYVTFMFYTVKITAINTNKQALQTRHNVYYNYVGYLWWKNNLSEFITFI